MSIQNFAPIRDDSVIVPVTRDELKAILVALTEYPMAPNYRVEENELIALSPSTFEWVIHHLTAQRHPIVGTAKWWPERSHTSAYDTYHPQPPATSFVKAAYVEVATRLDGNPTMQTASKEFDAWLAAERSASVPGTFASSSRGSATKGEEPDSSNARATGVTKGEES